MIRTLMLPVLLCSAACLAQAPNSYVFTAPYAVRGIQAVDMGGGNTFYASDHNFGYDSSYVDLTWTGPDRQVTSAASFKLTLSLDFLNGAARVDDGVLVCGMINGSSAYGPYFIKTDDMGVVQWSTGVGWPSISQEQATGLVSHGSGFSAYSTGGDTIYRYNGDLAGNITARKITTTEGSHLRVFNASLANVVGEDLVYGAGSLAGTDGSDQMGLLMRTDVNGAQWINYYDLGATGAAQTEDLWSGQQLTDGDFLAVGYITNTPATTAVALKISPTGAVIWCRKYEDATGALLMYGSIELPDHSLLLCGEDGSYTAVLLRIQANGDLVAAQRTDLGQAAGRTGLLRNDVGTLTMTSSGSLIELDDSGNGCGLSPLTTVTSSPITPSVHPQTPTSSAAANTMIPINFYPRTNSSEWTLNCSYTGIAELPLAQATVRMFPNPTTGLVQFSADAPARNGEPVLVRSVTGNVVYDGPYAGAIDLSALAAGVYSVAVPRTGLQAMVVKQ